MGNRLTPLQRDLLRAFFERETRFFLTGGAALAGFHTGHRTTQDLDLFTEEDAIEDGERALAGAAQEIGAVIERVQSAPDFRRRLVRRGSETVMVDLVRDRVGQIIRDKPFVGRIRLDPPEEIFVNKLCALLSRSEIRDLVDLLVLSERGFSVEVALRAAATKDAGFTPGQLAWVLGQMAIGDDARIPGDRKPDEIRRFLASLIETLRRAAYPKG
jgi:hypothetical protein